jgi:uncharacterized membrane protein YeaQ/YmgE (transglycosylase-associated protein family)
MLGDLIGFAIVGLIVGALGRLAVPGRQPMGCGATMLVGIAGSMLSGLLGRWLFDRQRGFSILLAVVCSAIIVWLLNRTPRRRVL